MSRYRWHLPDDPNRVLGGKQRRKKQNRPVALTEQVRRPQPKKVHTVSTLKKELRKEFMKKDSGPSYIKIGKMKFFS